MIFLLTFVSLFAFLHAPVICPGIGSLSETGGRQGPFSEEVSGWQDTVYCLLLKIPEGYWVEIIGVEAA
jgi:hypothetical protein